MQLYHMIPRYYHFRSQRNIIRFVLLLVVTMVFVKVEIFSKKRQLPLQLHHDIERTSFLETLVNSPDNTIQVEPGAIHAKTTAAPAYALQSSFIDLPPDLPLNSNFADITDPFHPGIDLPFYWRITKSASTATVAYLTICLDLVVASQKGANFYEPDLHIISQGDTRFVNVDVTTTPGIECAGRQGLVQSGIVDFIASGKLLEAAEHIYNQEHRGRLFSVFRHPIERMVSMKEYLAKAKWERLYDPELANMTMAEYIKDKNPMNNPITRQLVNKQSKHISLLPEDLTLAKEILRRKCIVGLVDRLEESMLRFQRYFGWKTKDYKWDGKEISHSQCKHQYLIYGRNRNPHEELEPGSAVWVLVQKFNEYDVSLYGYIVELFHQQSVLFP